MLSLIEYALAAKNIYKSDDPHVGITLPADLLNYKSTGWVTIPTLDPSMTPSSPLYCELYIYMQHKKPQAAAMVIRGTANLDNIEQDISTWTAELAGWAKQGDYPTHYVNTALAFYQKVKAYILQVAPQLLQSIVVVGHSLGGALAKILVAQYNAPKAVVFNAPGVAALIEHPHNTGAIYAVDSLYGMINKLGAHLPGRHAAQVDVPEQSHLAKLMLQAFDRKAKASFEHAAHTDMPHGLGSKLHGAFVEIKDVLSTATAFNSDPSYRRAQQDCDFFNGPAMAGLIAHSSCHAEIELEEYTEVISAQHSMNNLYQTLQLPSYKSLATTLI